MGRAQRASEKDTELAQTLGQLQPFTSFYIPTGMHVPTCIRLLGQPNTFLAAAQCYKKVNSTTEELRMLWDGKNTTCVDDPSVRLQTVVLPLAMGCCHFPECYAAH